MQNESLRTQKGAEAYMKYGKYEMLCKGVCGGYVSRVSKDLN